MATHRYLYKILDERPPSPLPETLPATDLDTKDGFIHLSTAKQTPMTASLFFSEHNNLWILKLEQQALDGRIEYSTDSNAGIENGCAHVYGSKKGLGKDNVAEILHVKKTSSKWTDVPAMVELEEN